MKQNEDEPPLKQEAKPKIGVVGPCKAGKTTLVRGLQQMGYNAHQIAQEHSFAPSMWQQIDPPNVLIFLQCEYPVTVARGLNWTQQEYDEQQPRLAHARAHADLKITTDEMNPSHVLELVLRFLNNSVRA